MQNPEFIGGIEALYSWLNDAVQYPKSAQQQGISAKVFVEFVVNEDGSISEASPMPGISVSSDLDAEAVRVVLAMPAWKPGYVDGKPALFKFVLPVSFSPA
jgi:periplasmic protein TonB